MSNTAEAAPVTATQKRYQPTDNVYERMSEFSKRLNIIADGLFSGFSKRTNAKIEWDYLSIHAIRRILNREMAEYGLYVHTKAQAPLPNMLPEEDVKVEGTLFARAWQNAIIVNITNPTDTITSDPTRGDVPFTDDKSISKAKQLAAKSALIAALNISVGEDPDATHHEILPANANATAAQTRPTVATDDLVFKLQAPQIGRFRELITQYGFTEAPLLAEVSRGRANRLDLPLTAQAIRTLMTKLHVDENRVNTFIDTLVKNTTADVPPSTPDERNANLALRRGLETLSEHARNTFLHAIGLKPEHIERLTDAQTAPLLARFRTFERTVRPPRTDLQPASRQTVAAGAR